MEASGRTWSLCPEREPWPQVSILSANIPTATENSAPMDIMTKMEAAFQVGEAGSCFLTNHYTPSVKSKWGCSSDICKIPPRVPFSVECYMEFVLKSILCFFLIPSYFFKKIFKFLFHLQLRYSIILVLGIMLFLKGYKFHCHKRVLSVKHYNGCATF